MIEPRRIVPPPNFGSDWKKIGSRRTKMITVQECSEPRRRILIVETNEKEESAFLFFGVHFSTIVPCGNISSN